MRESIPYTEGLTQDKEKYQILAWISLIRMLDVHPIVNVIKH